MINEIDTKELDVKLQHVPFKPEITNSMEIFNEMRSNNDQLAKMNIYKESHLEVPKNAMVLYITGAAVAGVIIFLVCIGSV